MELLRALVIALFPLVLQAGELTNIAQVSGTCAVMDSGGLKCWGWNLGKPGGWSASSPKPEDVPGLSSGVAAVAAGRGFSSCALTTSGGVKCWGNNLDGQLGDGTTTDRPTPVDVVGLGSGVVAISAGGAHACAVMADGGVKCWGKNADGQVGDGLFSFAGALTPVDVVGIGAQAISVAAGGAHTCVLTITGGVRCWGANSSGQLGDGTTIRRATPADVVGLTSGVIALDAGNAHTCALTSGGGVKCWGQNASGQVGDGTSGPDGSGGFIYRALPTDVLGLASGVAALSAGSAHNCALTSGGGVKCWGYNFFGQIGNGTRGGTNNGVPMPADVTGLASGVAGITTAAGTSCALLSGGTAKCWGQNDHGQVGHGWFIPAGIPPRFTDTWSYPVRVGDFLFQEILFPAMADRPIGGPPFQVDASASSGLPLAFTTTTPSVCGVSGSTVTLLALGTCIVVASQDGDAAYGEVKSVTRPFLVFDPSASRLTNISTRGEVLTAGGVMIAGFIIEGAAPKKVAIIVTGPSLANYGVPNQLSDPVLTLRRGGDSAVLASNDNWQSASNYQDLQARGFAPAHVLESALLVDLVPGAYTATVSGFNGSTGTALVAVYEIDHPEYPLVNVSSRGHVGASANVMIGGFIIEGPSPQTVAIVATGPSLANFGVPGVLNDPTLTLVRQADQSVIAVNDDWGNASNATQLQSAGFAPPDSREAAILVTLNPGAYTAILAGAGGTTGVGLVAVYAVKQ